jgi:hypothetical protein
VNEVIANKVNWVTLRDANLYNLMTEVPEVVVKSFNEASKNDIPALWLLAWDGRAALSVREREEVSDYLTGILIPRCLGYNGRSNRDAVTYLLPKLPELLLCASEQSRENLKEACLKPLASKVAGELTVKALLLHLEDKAIPEGPELFATEDVEALFPLLADGRKPLPWPWTEDYSQFKALDVFLDRRDVSTEMALKVVKSLNLLGIETLKYRKWDNEYLKGYLALRPGLLVDAFVSQPTTVTPKIVIEVLTERWVNEGKEAWAWNDRETYLLGEFIQEEIFNLPAGLVLHAKHPIVEAPLLNRELARVLDIPGAWEVVDYLMLNPELLTLGQVLTTAEEATRKTV